MNVQDSSGKSLHEARSQDAHETGEHDQRGGALAYGAGQRVIVFGAIDALDTGHRKRRNPQSAGRVEPGGVVSIGENMCDRIGGGTVLAMLDQGAHVAAASRYKDDDRRRRRRLIQAMTTPRVPARTSPIMSASWPAARRTPMARSPSLA